MQDFFEHFGWAKDQSLRLIPSIPRYRVEGEKVGSTELSVGGISTNSISQIAACQEQLRGASLRRAGEGILRQAQNKLDTSSASTWERRHKHKDFCMQLFFGLQIRGK